MKSPRLAYLFLITGLLVFNIKSLKAVIYPVVISEVFYDSPLEEDANNASVHHNGEFIELFNPTMEDIQLKNWKLQDSKGNTSYTFPENTVIPARGLIIVAYQYPNSNFKLSDLFPSINSLGLSAETLQKSILYQSNIMLNNNSEIIRLYNENYKLVDQMSYNHSSTFDSYNGYWDICAHNGSSRDHGIANLISLQRNNIHYTYSSITPLASDFTTASATPLQRLGDDSNYPTLSTLYENTETNYSSNVEVGSLPGASSVTPTGAATYQMPIEVPPGTNGVQPSLSVVYNSQGGFGVLGQGWDVSGLSVISRGTEDFYHDAKNGKLLSTSIEFNTNDKLNLDGQRLIFIGEESDYYFQAGGEYAMEVENYSRVKVKNSNVTGKIYFELTTKEGNVVEYGNTTNSIVTNASGSSDGKILAWRVNKVTDVNGNNITYEYTDNGQYVSKISYINNTVEFQYENNAVNPHQRYISTFLTKQDKLLKSITTKQDLNTVKTYGFNYLTSDMDMRLDNISLSSSDGKKINPTRIQWGTESKIEEVKLYKMWDGNLNNVANSHLYTGDIDGDGYADRIEMWEGSESTSELGYIAVTLKGNKKLPLMYFISTNSTYENFHKSLTIGDINGDGKDEIILIDGEFANEAIRRFVGTLNIDLATTIIYGGVNILGINSDNSSLVQLQHLSYSYEVNDDRRHIYPKWNTEEGYGYTPLLLNLNNDKYLDFVIIPYKNERFTTYENNEISYFYGSANGLGSIQTYSSDQYYIGASNPVIGDFNADGIIDIFRTNNNWIAGKGDNYIYKYNDSQYQLLPLSIYYTEEYLEFYLWGNETPAFEELLSVDYNNDGLSDILVRQGVTSDKKWKVLENKGGYFNFNKWNLDLHNFWRKYELEGDYAISIDYNGDGYQDMIIADDWRNHQYGKMDYEDYEQTYWYFYRNVGGKGYQLDDVRGGWRYFKQDNTEFAGLSRMNPVIMDINGDGIQDLVFGDRQGDSNSRYYRAFTMPNANKRNVVHSITNGMGQTEQFSYKYFSDYSTDPIDTSNPVRDLKAPVMIVDTYTDGLGGKTYYSYTKPKVHTEGKGFLGFETVTAANDMSKIKTVTTYEYNDTYFNVSVKHQDTYNVHFEGVNAVNNNILSSSEITNTTKSLGNKRYIPLITDQVSIDYLKNITQTTHNAYNDDGTLQSQEVITGDNTVFTEYQNYKKRTDDGLVAYLYQQIKVTNKHAGGTPDITHIGNMTYYDGTGQIHTKKENVGLYGETLTTYVYYSGGNINTVSVKPNGIKETLTSYYYTGDNDYRFPTNIKTTVDGVEYSNTSYTYDYSTGNVLTKTDNILNQTVTTEYNSFGSKTKETQPNGTVTTFKTEWSNARPNAVYKSTAQSLAINHTAVTYYDKFGREVYSIATGWKGKLIATSKSYNVSTGLLEKEVLPHYEGETEKYTTYVYGDFMHRLTSETFFDGVNSLTTTYSYPYNSHSNSVTTPNGQTKTTEIDASGLVKSITDGGGTIEYKDYNAEGQPQTITYGGANTTIAYDEMGRKWKLTDPNAGTIEYYYFADGQLRQQISAKGDITDMEYDDAGRVKTKTITNASGTAPVEDLTTYTYVPNGENGAGQVDNIEQTLDGILSHKQEFTYNTHHQIESATETYDNQTVTTTYGYDNLWRQRTTTTPSGLVTTDVYDAYGDVEKVTANGNVIWEGKDQNSSGQWLKYTLGNGLQTNKTYSKRQELETIQTGIDNNGTLTATVQNLSYGYDAPTGNLLTRKDILNNRNEVFTYDGLDRLLTGKLTGSVTYDLSMTYVTTDGSSNGNIDTKSDVGTYLYKSEDKDGNIRPNAMSGIAGVQAGVSTDKQFIDYTTFNKISEIRQGIDKNSITKKYDIYYGLDRQRIKSVYLAPDVSGGQFATQHTRYYFGAYEKDIDRFGNITQTDYIYTPAGLTAMVKNGTLYYIHTDNLGSVQAITNASKSIVSSYYYTPWGGRVLLSGANITDRGYTFHEHLTEFGLIDMNGRVYDPVLARFLSPDPYIQAPDYTQNFNRYSYVLNNPFKYTDPSGELFGIDDAIIIASALVGGIINWASNGAEFSLKGLGYFAAGAAVGVLSAVSGGWVAGVTQTAGVITGSLVGAGTGALTGAATNVTLNGLNNVIGGQNFWDNWQQSAMSGGISGGIFGGITGGITGYKLAQEKGVNMLWGSKINYGRTKWSFFTTEKPYEVIDFNIKNVGSSAGNDCVPTTFAEANKKLLDGTISYDEYVKITNYIEDKGVFLSRSQYEKLLRNNFNMTERLDPQNLLDPTSAELAQQSGDVVTVHMPYGSAYHADNIRSISYYSNKVIVKLRIGTFRLDYLIKEGTRFWTLPNILNYLAL